jgi:DNA-binding transcriptional ArsR family regulator
MIAITGTWGPAAKIVSVATEASACRRAYLSGASRRMSAMASHARFAEVASLAGDPARAAMLHALMDGRALTATELAQAATIAPQTASGHLTRMTTAGLLGVEKQGRNRYYRLASPAVAQMIEGIMQVAAISDAAQRPVVVGPRDAALRAARTCYDHLAGRLGVALADALEHDGRVELASDGGLVTEAGIAFFDRIGIDVGALTVRHGGRPTRVLCRPCLDWSERRPHLAGGIGAALCAHSFSHDWIRRIRGTRAVAITPKGSRVFREQFRVQLN